ncbi:hypothetical protein OV079_50500 [Nannocystis pusilla]|uniref:Uncharacterized protein n=1 Tax=Nannocystis pusilla TaxID=889268 RepID=A0A9X3F385_9BACT|nr:hypothetical protein [Nannocystis pusilla]MCY1013629.1 hypothetical protein [Nannocystis pusilla]
MTGDWGELGIDKVVVNATYQPNPAGPLVHTDGWTFAAPNEPARPFNVLIDRENPVRRYRYTTQVFLKDLANIESKARVLVKDDSTAQRDLVIHPANEFRPIQIALEAGPIDWNVTRQVDVVLKYDDPAHEFQAQQLFSFRQDRLAPQKWVVYPQDPELRGYEITFAYHLNDADNTYFRLAPVHSTEEAVIVPGPFRGAPRRVQLIPAVKAEDVRGISAEILFEKGGYRFHRQEDFGADDLKPRWVQIPAPDPDPKSDAYQVRWSITTADWDVQEYAWRHMTTAQCLLGDGTHGVESIRLVFTRSVAEAGLTSLVVTVETLTPTGEVIDDDTLVLRGAATEAATQLLVLQASPLAYRYRLKKVIGADSQSVESTTNHARRLVVDL